MKGKRYGPFTLFLCLLLITFLLFAPYFLSKPDMDKFLDKIFQKEIQWQGIITIWDYPRLDITTGYKYSWLRDKIKEFEKEHPGVFIEFKPLDPDFGHIEIETAIKTNTNPDIAPVGTDYGLIDKGVLEPVEEFFQEEELDKYKIQAISAVKYKNHIWGFPYMMENYILFLNLDIFNQNNIKPPEDGNWTYDEFIDIAKKLTYNKDSRSKTKEIYGFNSHISPNDYSIWGIVLSDGAEILNRKTYEYSFNDERAISGVKKLVDIKQIYGVTPENFGENSKNQAWRSFAINKKVAIYPGKSSMVNKLRRLNNAGKGFNFGVANYPIGELGIPISSNSSVAAYGVFKQEDKKKLEMCVEFIKHLTDDESQKEIHKQAVFPAKKNANDIYKNDKIMESIEKNLAYSKPIGIHHNWRRIHEILQTQIRMALLGKKTVEEAIKDATNQVNQINK